jgi:hypothetical protein
MNQVGPKDAWALEEGLTRNPGTSLCGRYPFVFGIVRSSPAPLAHRERAARPPPRRFEQENLEKIR